MPPVNMEGLHPSLWNHLRNPVAVLKTDEIYSIAYADPTPGKDDMTVCPVFFKSDNPESKNNLNSRHMRAPEGERPVVKGLKRNTGAKTTRISNGMNWQLSTSSMR